MIDESDAETGPRLRQIELNTISSSFGPLGALVSQLHGTLYPGLPRNDTGNEFAHSIAAALRQWSKALGESDGVVLFVVQDGERNLYDQWWIADPLRSRFGVRTIRASLAQVAETSTVDDNGVLKVAGSKGEPTIRWGSHRGQRCAAHCKLLRDVCLFIPGPPPILTNNCFRLHSRSRASPTAASSRCRVLQGRILAPGLQIAARVGGEDDFGVF